MSIGRRRFAALLWLVASLAAAPTLTAQEPAAHEQRHRRILLLYSNRDALPGNAILGDAIRSALDAGIEGPIEFYSEHLDVSRFPGDGHLQLQSDFLRRRYFYIQVLQDRAGLLLESRATARITHLWSSKPDGLGMGLAISRSIVQAHGGRIWAASNPDRGLTLHVELPAEAGAA